MHGVRLVSTPAAKRASTAANGLPESWSVMLAKSTAENYHTRRARNSAAGAFCLPCPDVLEEGHEEHPAPHQFQRLLDYGQ